MKLRDLNAKFLKVISPSSHQYVDTLGEADGVMFQCPLCAQGKEPFEEDGERGFRGAHYVMCWFRHRPNVPDDLEPGPGRWTPQGTGIYDLTFVPGNPPMACSVLLTGGCGWHGFVSNGDAT